MNIDLDVLLDSEIHVTAEFDEQIKLNPTMQRMIDNIKILTN